MGAKSKYLTKILSFSIDSHGQTSDRFFDKNYFFSDLKKSVENSLPIFSQNKKKKNKKIEFMKIPIFGEEKLRLKNFD